MGPLQNLISSASHLGCLQRSDETEIANGETINNEVCPPIVGPSLTTSCWWETYRRHMDIATPSITRDYPVSLGSDHNPFDRGTKVHITWH